MRFNEEILSDDEEAPKNEVRMLARGYPSVVKGYHNENDITAWEKSTNI